MGNDWYIRGGVGVTYAIFLINENILYIYFIFCFCGHEKNLPLFVEGLGGGTKEHKMKKRVGVDADPNS